MSDVTRILNAIERGDAKATDELLPLVYEELRLLAAQRLSHEAPGQTLQATALVHEAYLRLVGDALQSWESRGHFFAAAAEAMRRILVENARRKKSLKRGGDYSRVELLATDLPLQGSLEEILALEDALARLSQTDPAVAAAVNLYYFAGLTLDQIARVQGLSRPTVAKRLAYGRAWLHRDLLGADET
ncbi:MAG: sigma-70 family RNA polymerase sigma factor [Planctomycetes bacterium]|nr:sigma-70 family RNA polymerase sigma factor [Planctomycetota bacterium]